MHEAQLHKRNCVVTLTYDPEHVPADGSLHYRHFQLFMKKLRKRHGKVRFFVCGEYGDKDWRPHFHACLFGYRPGDLRPWSKSRSGSQLFRSPELESLWPAGHSLVGELDFESAAYIARYIMKKVTGDAAESHYNRINFETGELLSLEPEFIHMSLRPGIGAEWFSKFHTDVYPKGMVVSRGHEARPPKFYDRRFAKLDPDGYAQLQLARETFAADHVADSMPERLAARAVVTAARVSLHKRTL
ncbi:MAG: replication initiator protein [Microviridae sp.]|nr:MAG: replication initiator protein [Microviridae sp.]